MEKPTRRRKREVTVRRGAYYTRKGTELGISTESLVWVLYPRDAADPVLFAARQSYIQRAVEEMIDKIVASGSDFLWEVSLGPVEKERRLRTGGLYRGSGCPYYLNLRAISSPLFMQGVLSANRSMLAGELNMAATAQCPIEADAPAEASAPEVEIIPPTAEPEVEEGVAYSVDALDAAVEFGAHAPPPPEPEIIEPVAEEPPPPQPEAAPRPDLMTYAQVAAYLGVSLETVRREISEYKRLKPILNGTSTLMKDAWFDPANVESVKVVRSRSRYLAKQTQAEPRGGGPQPNLPAALATQGVGFDPTPCVFDRSEFKPVTFPDGDKGLVAEAVVKALDAMWDGGQTISHVPEKWKAKLPVDTGGGIQEVWCLKEPGVWFYLGRSDKPKAVPLQEFIAGEVLPQVSRTGSYRPEGPTELTMQDLLTHQYNLLAGMIRQQGDTLTAAIAQLRQPQQYAESGDEKVVPFRKRPEGENSFQSFVKDYNKWARKEEPRASIERMRERMQEDGLLYYHERTKRWRATKAGEESGLLVNVEAAVLPEARGRDRLLSARITAKGTEHYIEKIRDGWLDEPDRANEPDAPQRDLDLG